MAASGEKKAEVEGRRGGAGEGAAAAAAAAVVASNPEPPGLDPAALEELKEAEVQLAKFQQAIAEAAMAQNAVKKASLRLAKQASKVKDEALQARLKALKAVVPETRSLFSRLMLGRVNLKVWNAAEKDRLRDEYNKYRFRSNVIFMVFPIAVLFAHFSLRYRWADVHWFIIMQQVWLLYYYTSLALRENILLVNGSNIRPWWIMHHYIAAFGTVILITWPSSPTYLKFTPYWNLFLTYQGFCQMLQLAYQSRRDYANRALGRAGRMDVAFSETLTEFPKELVMLVPFLYIAFLWQIALGVMLLRTLASEFDVLHTHWTMFREEVQMFISGCVCIILGVGNSITTFAVLKRKSSALRRHAHSIHASPSSSTSPVLLPTPSALPPVQLLGDPAASQSNPNVGQHSNDNDHDHED